MQNNEKLLDAFRRTAPVIIAALRTLNDFDADEAAKAAGGEQLEARIASRREAVKVRALAEHDMNDAVRYYADGAPSCWLWEGAELTGFRIGSDEGNPMAAFSCREHLDPQLDAVVTEPTPEPAAEAAAQPEAELDPRAHPQGENRVPDEAAPEPEAA